MNGVTKCIEKDPCLHLLLAGKLVSERAFLSEFSSLSVDIRGLAPLMM
mgnify:CR=1 FL=1